MAQLDRLQKSPVTTTPNSRSSQAFGEFLQGDASSPSSYISPASQDDDNVLHNKKSVLTKVKEKAKKLRYSLSGKRRHGNDSHDGNITQSWGVSMGHDDQEDEISGKKEHGNESYDDNMKKENESHGNSITPPLGVSLKNDKEDEDDPEYLGAPMYESELAPETCKETARQHPRADPVVPENHSLATCTKTEVEEKKDNSTTQNERDHLTSPNKTITETMSEKLAPAYAAMSDATHSIASKLAGLAITIPKEPETEMRTGETAALSASPGSGKMAGKGDGPTSLQRSPNIREHGTGSPQKWDIGVSVKEYFMQKVEPGEDERALSKVISETISPRTSPAEMGVVKKVKEAVTSFLRPEEPSHSTTKIAESSLDPISTNAQRLPSQANYTTNTNSSSQIPISNSKNLSLPVSSAAHEVIEEENHGRVLQAN